MSLLYRKMVYDLRSKHYKVTAIQDIKSGRRVELRLRGGLRTWASPVMHHRFTPLRLKKLDLFVEEGRKSCLFVRKGESHPLVQVSCGVQTVLYASSTHDHQHLNIKHLPLSNSYGRYLGNTPSKYKCT